MKIIKNKLRSRMNNTRLNALGGLTMGKSMLKEEVVAGKDIFQEKILQYLIGKK